MFRHWKNRGHLVLKNHQRAAAEYQLYLAENFGEAVNITHLQRWAEFIEQLLEALRESEDG